MVADQRIPSFTWDADALAVRLCASLQADGKYLETNFLPDPLNAEQRTMIRILLEAEYAMSTAYGKADNWRGLRDNFVARQALAIKLIERFRAGRLASRAPRYGFVRHSKPARVIVWATSAEGVISMKFVKAHPEQSYYECRTAPPAFPSASTPKRC